MFMPDLELAEVEESRAQRPLANHLQVRIAQAIEQVEHLQCDVAGRRDFARDDVMRRHPDQHGDDSCRIVDLVAQLAGTRVGLTHLGDGVAAAGLDAQAVGHLKTEFGGRLRGRIGLAFKQREAAARQALGFVVRVEPGRRLRGLIPVLGGANIVARRFEQQGDLGGARARLSAEPGDELLRNCAAEHGPPGRAQRRIEGVVIDVMREPVAQRQLTVVGLVLVNETHQRVLAFEPFERVLDILFGPLEHRRQERRIEVDALDGCRTEQASIVIVERIDLALHETSNRLRQFPAQRRQILADDPRAILLLEHLPPAEVAQQIDDEERVAFGALLDEAGESARERMIRELQREIAIDRGLVEISGRDFPAGAARNEVELERQERVLCLRELGRPARGDDQQPHRVDSPRKISDEIGRRGVRPVHVVKTQHDRMDARDLLEQRADFPFETLLRADRHVGGQTRGR